MEIIENQTDRQEPRRQADRCKHTWRHCEIKGLPHLPLLLHSSYNLCVFSLSLSPFMAEEHEEGMRWGPRPAKAKRRWRSQVRGLGALGPESHVLRVPVTSDLL